MKSEEVLIALSISENAIDPPMVKEFKYFLTNVEACDSIAVIAAGASPCGRTMLATTLIGTLSAILILSFIPTGFFR